MLLESCDVILVVFFTCGLLLFFQGFFLTRRELGLLASTKNDRTLSELLLKGSFDDKILPRKRVFLFIVDGLRHDFLAPQQHARSVHNNFRYAHYLLENNQSQSLLVGLKAEPPTVTSQRLKAMTTGTLPTFIDAGSNLNSSAITEDNILDQLRSSFPSDRTVVLGDDTWAALFPQQFHEAHVFDSFNTRDLDTVDDGILSHLDGALASPWRLLVVHFLGVDHIGHTHNAFHPLMATRLQKMDDVLRYVIERLPSDGVLLLCGDHGMTDEGEHGGASQQETDTALFVYSKHPMFSAAARDPSVMIPQTDLVPTLAMLLGVLLPFSSLGVLLPDLLPDRAARTIAIRGVNRSVTLPCALLEAVSRNALQHWRYLSAYFAPSLQIDQLLHLDDQDCSTFTECIDIFIDRIDQEHLVRQSGHEQWLLSARSDLLVALHDHLQILSALSMGKEMSVCDQEKVIDQYLRLMRGVQETTRTAWTQFSDHLALPGLAIVLAVALWSCRDYLILFAEAAADNFMWIFPVIFHLACTFSDSFIAAESAVVQFALQTLMLCTARRPMVLIACVMMKALHCETLHRFLISSPRLCVVMHSVLSCVAVWCAQQASQNWQHRAHNAALLCSQSALLLHMMNMQSPVSLPLLVLGFSCAGMLLQCTMVMEATLKATAATIGVILHSLVCLYTLHPHHVILIDGCLLVGFLHLHFSASVHPVAASEQPQILRHAAYCSLWGRCLFFLTDHAMQLDKLQLSVGFIGVSSFHFYYAGSCLLINTFGADILALFLCVYTSECPSTSLRSFLSLRMMQTALSCLSAWVLRRHLMLWAVFAPKLFFEAAMYIVVLIVVAVLTQFCRLSAEGSKSLQEMD